MCFCWPNYDEYLIAYKDRETVQSRTGFVVPLRDSRPHHLVLDGRVEGNWKRTLARDSVNLEVAFRRRPSAIVRRALAGEAARYAEFAGRGESRCPACRIVKPRAGSVDDKSAECSGYFSC